MFVATALATASTTLAVPARGDTLSVSIVDSGLVPPRISVLATDTVGWRNSSLINKHTVTGGDFDSGPIVPGGGFFHDFTVPGAYPYHCTIHPYINGEVDVYALLLNGPGRAVARGAATTLNGRAAPGVQALTIEEDTGTGFRSVATAQATTGVFRAVVRPNANALYRAVSGSDASPPVQVEVSDRSDLTIRATGRRLRVHVEPPNPGARVSLQLKLRERFGWWTVARDRLDRRSGASFAIRRRGSAKARVVLTQGDGWTPLAVSRVVRVGGQNAFRRS
jgi:plastocyanin